MFEISCTTNRCNSERISGRGICNQCRNWFRKIPAQSKVFQKENVTLLLQQAKSEACGMGSNKLHASFKKQPECRGVRTRLWLSQCFLKIRFEIKVASGSEVFFLKIFALTWNFLHPALRSGHANFACCFSFIRQVVRPVFTCLSHQTANSVQKRPGNSNHHTLLWLIAMRSQAKPCPLATGSYWPSM